MNIIKKPYSLRFSNYHIFYKKSCSISIVMVYKILTHKNMRHMHQACLYLKQKYKTLLFEILTNKVLYLEMKVDILMKAVAQCTKAFTVRKIYFPSKDVTNNLHMCKDKK